MKEIPLTKGYVAVVDDEDYEKISRHRWYVNLNKRRQYAHRQYRYRGKQVLVLMHRLIINAPKGKNVDHIDGDGLNNQKSNLRLCTQAQNLWNQCRWSKNGLSRRYKGVQRDQKGKWAVFISINGVTHRLGRYAHEIAAAREYDKLARLLHGEFAFLNFPQKGERGAQCHKVE